MKKTLFMDFSVDKEENQINVKREFAAPLKNVWAAWTESELLDQWWAPKPYKTKTKSMDFREGGMWLYAMVSPEGQKHWCRNDYEKISHHKNFNSVDSFCDEEGNINTDFPSALWETRFNASEGSTFVNVQTTYDTLADLEKILEMGVQEGLTAALENLDELLEAQTK
ncbi:MAG: SRPBCC domain-containing protein [Bacteroidia bacterium]